MLVLHQDHLPLRKMEVQMDGAVSEAVRKVFNIQGKKKTSKMLSLNRLKKEPPWKLCQPQAKQRHVGMGWENGNAGSNCGPRKAPLQHCSLHWHLSLELVLENTYWRRGKTRVFAKGWSRWELTASTKLYNPTRTWVPRVLLTASDPRSSFAAEVYSKERS